MNVLRVIPSMNPERGGPCQGIRNSVPEMLKLGVISEVVCLDDPASEYLGKDAFSIHALGEAKGPWAYNPELQTWLNSNLARFDVVIIHGLWLYHSYITNKVVRTLRNQQQPVVIPQVYVMPHGMLDPWFQKAEGRKLKAIRNWIYWKLIEKRVVNEAEGLLFTSSEELKLARKSFSQYHPKKELNIGYGIMAPPPYTEEMSSSLQKACPTLNNNPYILFLSRIHVKKGLNLLINGYLELKGQGLDLPKLIIAGPGLESTYGKEISALAASDPDIIFAGMLTGSRKWGAFYGCEAFILPSHQENFGISVVEALACGRPVLISDQVNIWNEIKEGSGGFVSKDNKQGVKELLLQWISLPREEKNRMSEQAKKVYEKNYAITQAASKLKSTLEN